MHFWLGCHSSLLPENLKYHFQIIERKRKRENRKDGKGEGGREGKRDKGREEEKKRERKMMDANEEGFHTKLKFFVFKDNFILVYSNKF